MRIDANHQQFSSDINNGGIRMGGQSGAKVNSKIPTYVYHAGPPVHDAQRAVISPSFTPKASELSGLIRERAGDILDNCL